ncbi:MAG TPA: hypothetical protein H9706_00875 [Candidatus Gemmiger stercorigallinarum]|nr:hypothetical protein [Candidatus Gemmiger stercorigallinarum]
MILLILHSYTSIVYNFFTALSMRQSAGFFRQNLAGIRIAPKICCCFGRFCPTSLPGRAGRRRQSFTFISLLHPPGRASAARRKQPQYRRF